MGFCLVVWITGLWTGSNGQEIRFQPRYSYYTNQDRAEVMLVLPEGLINLTLHVSIGLDNKIVFEGDTISRDKVLSIGIPVERLETGEHPLFAWITQDGRNTELKSTLVRLQPKSNAVQIDRMTGGLIVNGLPWFPFGFYCYSPVQPNLAEEEVVRGFNLMSPYQAIDPRTIKDREAYMDRCARLGMKVHYQLISVAGGGGVGSSRLAGLSQEEKLNRLKSEIQHFRDHPALLAWYLSDEPTGHGAKPDSLQKLYEFIHSLDPYHPVTIVFDAPKRAREYAAAMDIVMADPYPIPNSGVEGVGAATEGLLKEFAYEKPVWIVPQAFGGGEWWGREPSPAEIRVMTWLALVRGATGIQYFIRHAPNGFPKSNVTWGECSKMAMEVARITPYLLTGVQIPEMMKESDGVWSNGWRLGDEYLIIAVNAENNPRESELDLPVEVDSGEAEVLFENRMINISEGKLKDWIGPMGTQVYRLNGQFSKSDDSNLLRDPGFESTMSYGVPAACYARVGADRGSTAFLDTRVKKEGYQSLRMTTPADNLGMGLSFFPVNLNSGQSYSFRIWARADTASWLPVKRTFWQRLLNRNKGGEKEFRVLIPGLADQSFGLTSAWQPASFYFTVPEQGSEQVKVNPYLELISQGTAWFDDMALREDPLIRFKLNSELRKFEVEIGTVSNGFIVRYNIEGEKPKESDPVYTGPFSLDKTSTVSAGLFDGEKLVTWASRTFRIHKAMGKEPEYRYPYAPRYNGGGAFALVDGVSGSRNYLDGRWQGLMGKDLDVKIDLGSVQPVSRVGVGCLQDISSWIFMPLKLAVEVSTDGVNYSLFGETANTVDPHKTGAIRQVMEVAGAALNTRYIRVRAENMRICPDWHNGKGQAAFIFVDEITVE